MSNSPSKSSKANAGQSAKCGGATSDDRGKSGISASVGVVDSETGRMDGNRKYTVYPRAPHMFNPGVTKLKDY